MLTKADLEQAFRAYLDEIQRCIEGKCYWALLHVLVVLPDICGALEAPDGEATGRRYEAWCARYLADPVVTEKDWYGIRCVVLHQGRTLANRGQYVAYSFSQPTERGGVVHRMVGDSVNGSHLHLDVGKLADQVTGALPRWFAELESNADPARSANVVRNLPFLARVGLSGGGPIRAEMTIHQTFTTSSLWP